MGIRCEEEEEEKGEVEGGEEGEGEGEEDEAGEGPGDLELRPGGKGPLHRLCSNANGRETGAAFGFSGAGAEVLKSSVKNEDEEIPIANNNANIDDVDVFGDEPQGDECAFGFGAQPSASSSW